MENIASNEVKNEDVNKDSIQISMNIHLIIRRKKVTLYLDTVDNITILQLKKMIEAILKIKPEDQQLFVMFANDCSLDKYKELSNSAALLSDYELNSMTASAIYPAILGLAVRQEDGSFEKLEITPYSELEWPNLQELEIEDQNCSEQHCAAFRKKYDKMLQQLEFKN